MGKINVLVVDDHQQIFETIQNLLSADGVTTDQISQLHSISENTVESIRKRLLLKMDARNMAQLVSKAHKIGLITNYRTDAEIE